MVLGLGCLRVPFCSQAHARYWFHSCDGHSWSKEFQRPGQALFPHPLPESLVPQPWCGCGVARPPHHQLPHAPHWLSPPVASGPPTWPFTAPEHAGWRAGLITSSQHSLSPVSSSSIFLPSPSLVKPWHAKDTRRVLRLLATCSTH